MLSLRAKLCHGTRHSIRVLLWLGFSLLAVSFTPSFTSSLTSTLSYIRYRNKTLNHPQSQPRRRLSGGGTGIHSLNLIGSPPNLSTLKHSSANYHGKPASITRS